MDFDALYLRSLHFLNFRPRSEKEVRDYLTKKLKSHPELNQESHRNLIPARPFGEGSTLVVKAGYSPLHGGIQKKEWIPDQVRDDNNQGVIDLIIHKLKEQRFLNDLEFAKWLTRSRTEFKPKGKYLVKQELKQKGIAQDIIEEVLGPEVRTQSDKDLAIQVLEQKKKKYASMDHNERFHKAGSMLARRGFDLDAIRTAIDAVFGKMV